MGVSKRNGTPKSSILIGFSIINHPFWDTTIFGNTHIEAMWVETYNRFIQNETLISTVAPDDDANSAENI